MHEELARILVRADGISKRFGGIIALNNVSFSLRQGEIMGLVGHNGAGKSVLIKIMGGIVKPDKGQILFEEKPARLESPRDAQEKGYYVVPQELNLARKMSVADNIFIGRQEYASRWTGIVKRKKNEKEASALLKDYFNATVRTSRPVGELDAVTQRIVEVVRSLRSGAKVIVFDETTAGLSRTEKERLFEHIRLLSEKGIGIIFITHILSEAMTICHTITVLRAGEIIGAEPVGNLSHAKLIEMIVGSSYRISKSSKSTPTSEILLSLKNVSSKDSKLSGITFDLHAGEILGLYGLRDQGQTALLETIAGAKKRTPAICSYKERVERANPLLSP